MLRLTDGVSKQEADSEIRNGCERAGGRLIGRHAQQQWIPSVCVVGSVSARTNWDLGCGVGTLRQDKYIFSFPWIHHQGFCSWQSSISVMRAKRWKGRCSLCMCVCWDLLIRYNSLAQSESWSKSLTVNYVSSYVISNESKIIYWHFLLSLCGSSISLRFWQLILQCGVQLCLK